MKGTTTTPSIIQRFGFVLGLNLAEISCNVKFNKTIDGGAGIGYFINDNFQVSLMLDVTSVRQIRDHIVNSYENQPIPKTTNENYNALDSADEQLFYSKTLFGALLKFVFSL